MGSDLLRVGVLALLPGAVITGGQGVVLRGAALRCHLWVGGDRTLQGAPRGLLWEDPGLDGRLGPSLRWRGTQLRVVLLRRRWGTSIL